MSKLSEAISEMRNMRESYDQVATAAEAYNVGKTQLAEAITSKGVETSPSESYPEMAEKVNAISQKTYEINGGEMYAKQLFGSLTTPKYWNLYEVLAQLLSDGRLVNYGGILLAEYYKGYDSLALSGAGSGGAYVVSDKDENGQFIMYTSDVTHIWNTKDDEIGNRFVAYCFADECHDFQITDTNTSPRSIFIGRKVGTITSLVNGRVSQIEVPDGNELTNFIAGTYTQVWDRKTVIRNLKKIGSNTLLYSPSCLSIFVQAEEISSQSLIHNPDAALLSSIIVVANKLNGAIIRQDSFTNLTQLRNIIISGIIQDCTVDLVTANTTTPVKSISHIGFINVEAGTYYFRPSTDESISTNLKNIYISYDNNDKTKTITFAKQDYRGDGWKYIEDVELKNEWCKPLVINTLTSLTEENMYAHILQRLKQDEPDCGDGVTITLGSTNLAKLTSEESVQLLDDLTNIYGYTFA